jgi:hypothetical protein
MVLGPARLAAAGRRIELIIPSLINPTDLREAPGQAKPQGTIPLCKEVGTALASRSGRDAEAVNGRGGIRMCRRGWPKTWTGFATDG